MYEMSIFKVKQWWSSSRSHNEEHEDGTQNSQCIKVDRFDSHNDGDCLIVGQGTLLEIHKPNIEIKNSHPILESQLSDFILQIETGKFLLDCSDRQILILHPNTYVVYLLTKTSGQLDVGEQNSIIPVIRHSFNRRASNLTCGSFGSSKSRDLICIQALDGTLSFFDQDTFLFMCVFDDVIIPGPVCYITNSDQFIICKSTWVMEIFSFQQLCEFSELSVRQNKKNIPQWTYNAGEEIGTIQIIRTSTNFSTIVAIGERHLYCFQDNGLMKYMVRFDYMPICFHAYLIGWYYEPNSRLLVMVVSEDAKLNVYEGTSLLWSCDLMHQAISVSRCYLNSLSGGIVTLSSDGVVRVSYLGTEPDLNANGQMMSDTVDPSKIQAELEVVEESLQKVMEAKDVDEDVDIDRILKIKVEIGDTQNNPTTHYTEGLMPLQTCPVVLILTCDDPKSIHNIQITYHCVPPVTSSETTICLDNINGTEILETFVHLGTDADISDCGVNIQFTVILENGKIRILSKRIMLPVNFYCVPVEVVIENQYRIGIKTNRQTLDFTEMFPNFTKEELTRAVSKKMITLEYRTSRKTVTLNISESAYTIEGNNISEMAPIIDLILNNLDNYYTKLGISDFDKQFILNGELTKQIVHAFLKSIEAHVKERVKLKGLEQELNILQKQFTLVQKRLLVQYGSLPPGDCDPLEFLMKDTHERIKTVAHGIMQSKQDVLRAGNVLRSIGSLIAHIMKQTLNDNLKLKLIEEMLSFDSLNGQFQEWEEAVAQGLTYILNKIFKKSEKDKEKLATVTDQDILSQTNLKKLLKQLRIIFEKILMEQNTEEKGNITRIEEIVEVI